jgi:hypothetical protein
MLRKLGPEPVPIFYADETFLDIEGKSHILLAAISFSEPQVAIARILKVREDFNIPLSMEIKWNQQALPSDLRYQISDRMLYAVATSSEGLISICEGSDKQGAAEMMLRQIAEHSRSPFGLYLDKNLCPDVRKLWEYAQSYLVEPAACVSLQETESCRDQLIQCVDVFAGLYKTAIEHILRGKSKPRKYYDPSLREELDDTVAGHILLATRYLLPGTVDCTAEELEAGKLPFKDSWGSGIQLKSSVSQGTKDTLRKMAMSYIGCMH